MMEKYRAFTERLHRLFLEMRGRYIGRAGEAIGTKIKSDKTPETSLDHHALQQVRQLISAHFPTDFTIGEEDQKNPEEMRHILARNEQFQWTIDGLDGTGNLILGTNSYGAMVARRRGQHILYAAIFRPIDNALRGDGMFFAVHGQGAWEIVVPASLLAHKRLVTVKSGELPRMTIMLEGSSKKFFKPPISRIGLAETTRPSCSTSIAATTVARGKASALVTIENKPWDNWPAWLLIREAGGVVTDFQGGLLTPENCGNMLAAANADDHARIVWILKGGDNDAAR